VKPYESFVGVDETTTGAPAVVVDARRRSVRPF